jgi:S-adenosylmethionine:diacylglycerol 3-amino-3-carboxypropyl transferase
MMIHPLAEDFTQLKDNEVEMKLQELSKKYWQTQNPMVRQQIAVFVDIYKTELSVRRAKMVEQQHQKRDKDLDKLIKIN